MFIPTWGTAFRSAVLQLALLCLWAPALLGAQVHVRGYYRSDGTYVAPHMRSSPNGTTADNWSTRGNVNPYTGKPGTVARGAPSYPLVYPPRADIPEGDAGSLVQPERRWQHMHATHYDLRGGPSVWAPVATRIFRGDSVWIGMANAQGWAVALNASGLVLGYVNVNLWGFSDEPPTPPATALAYDWTPERLLRAYGAALAAGEDPERLAEDVYAASGLTPDQLARYVADRRRRAGPP